MKRDGEDTKKSKKRKRKIGKDEELQGVVVHENYDKREEKE
jgi:hypothetical protein